MSLLQLKLLEIFISGYSQILDCIFSMYDVQLYSYEVFM